jgi:predicted alpha/beta hydrolase family esterase
MTDIIIIGGGDSYLDKKDYLEDLRKKSVKEIDKIYYWKDNLAQKFRDLGFSVLYIEMPNKQNAQYYEWEIVFKKITSSLHEKTVCIGHSLGGVFLAKYFSENQDFICTLHLVAPDYNCGQFSFDKKKIEHLSSHVKYIHLWQSSDDPYLSQTNGLKYREVLKHYKLYEFTNRGHFFDTNFTELEDEILSNN